MSKKQYFLPYVKINGKQFYLSQKYPHLLAPPIVPERDFIESIFEAFAWEIGHEDEEAVYHTLKNQLEQAKNKGLIDSYDFIAAWRNTETRRIAAVVIGNDNFFLSSLYPKLFHHPTSDLPAFIFEEMTEQDFVPDLENALVWYEEDKDGQKAIIEHLKQAKNKGLIVKYTIMSLTKTQ